MSSVRLIAIRHGETQWNAEQRVQGHLDSALTQRGIGQSRALAVRLSRERFSVLYSSDLGRAMRTAEIISELTRTPIIRESGLRERNMGIFEGLTKNEMARRFPVEYSDYQRVGHGYRIPQGESGQDRFERSIRVLTEIASRHPGGAIAAVTHGGFLMGFFEHVLGVPPGNGWQLKPRNAAYNCAEYSRGTWRLETWNETSYLNEFGTTQDPIVT